MRGNTPSNLLSISKNAPFIVADPRARMSNFIYGVSELVSKECKTAMLVKEMDISCLMTYAKKIKEEKLRVFARDSKRAQVKSGGFSH